MAYTIGKTKPHADFTKCHKLFYGPEGSGKTTLAAKMKDERGKYPFFILAEDGQGDLELDAVRIYNWQDLLDFVDKEIVGNQKFREKLKNEHSCLVFDPINFIDDMAADHVSKANKVTYIGDLPHGKGWNAHELAFKTLFQRFVNFMPCVFLAHLTDREFLYNAETVKILAPTLGKRTMRYVNSVVDIIGFCAPANSQREHRSVIFRPELGRVAKSRFAHMNRTFVNKEGAAAQTWAEMQKVFGERPAVKIVNESDEQQVTSDRPVEIAQEAH